MSTLYIGLDAGGSKTAALARVGTETRRFDGPGAQATRDGTDAVADRLAPLVQEVRAAFEGADLGGLAVGLAGAGTPDLCDAVRAALRERIGPAPLAVTHDADIALEAAFGEGSGAVLLVGTGSMVYARAREGTTARAGGWGPALGDDGSGAALGRAALRAALAALDGGPPTDLGERLAADFELPTREALVAAAHGATPSLARFAPALLAAAQADDWQATQILARETNALGQQAGWLATRLGDAVEPRVATCGGLSGEPVYRAAIEGALARYLPGWDVARCEAEPVEGALALAQRLAPA